MYPKIVVGVGSSAGGVEALKSIINGLSNQEVAYVIIQHLSPHHESMMVKILEKLSKLDVLEVRNGMSIEAGKIYTTPPGQLIAIENGKFTLEKIKSGANRAPLHTVDIFLESLAKCYNEKSIGVILSGSGSDGLRGCRAIKEAGGAVIAQDPTTAQFSSMPLNIVSANLADLVVNLCDLSERLSELINRVVATDDLFNDKHDEQEIIDKIIEYISSTSGINFSNYKNSTLHRRINKHMAIKKIESAEKYFSLIKREPEVCTAIASDFLIGVTAFFRDFDFFESLKKHVINGLEQTAEEGDEIRVWVPACSTGEEAYSIAMLLEEMRSLSRKSIDYRIFGSDIDSKAINTAQTGVYRKALLEELPANFRNRYFKEYGDELYVVKREIKDRIIFSKHDITSDPPFGRMDLISFRNCAIYLDKSTQNDIHAILEHSLNIGGYLFLGASEGLPSDSLMETINATAKIYKKTTKKTKRSHFDVLRIQNDRIKNKMIPRKRHLSSRDELFLNVGHSMIADLAGPSVAITGEGELLHVFGDISKYAQLKGGAFGGTFFDFLQRPMKSAITLAMKRLLSSEADNKTIIRVNGSNSDDEDNFSSEPVFLEIHYYKYKNYESIFTITFSDEPARKRVLTKEGRDVESIEEKEIQLLREELSQSRKDLEFSIENLETTNEELQSTNEELVTSNEELQSTNEELQSVNEELHTMNAEFQDKIEELSLLNRDVEILLNVSKVGTLFLDQDLEIRRISKQASDIMGLKETDIGRSISQFREPLYDNFIDHCLKVLKSDKAMETQVEITPQNWYLVKIHPYKKTQNSTVGIIVVVVNISELKAIKESNSWLHRFLLSGSEAHFSVDLEGNIDSWAKSAEEFFGFSESYVVGKNEGMLLPLSSRTDLEIIQDNIISGETVYLKKTSRMTKDDGVVPVTIIAYGRHDERGKLNGILYTIFKFSDENDGDNKVESELNMLRQVLEASQVGILVLDVKGRFKFANKYVCDILGLSQQEIYSREFDADEWKVEDINGGEMDVGDYPFTRVISGKEPIEDMQLTLVTGKNKRIRITCNGAPFLEKGEVTGGVFNIREI